MKSLLRKTPTIVFIKLILMEVTGAKGQVHSLSKAKISGSEVGEPFPRRSKKFLGTPLKN